MKFLVDVNASGTLGRWLTEMGHDVVFVSDSDPRMKDEDIIDWAVREGRIILTTDNDNFWKILVTVSKNCFYRFQREFDAGDRRASTRLFSSSILCAIFFA